MTDRPILFSGPMVRALIEGRKTQTRRLLRNPEYYGCPTGDCPHEYQSECNVAMQQNALSDAKYAVGDRLWVREAWATMAFLDNAKPTNIGKTDGLFYPSTSTFNRWAGEGWGGAIGRPRSPIHMPRWASRLTLTVTDVRVHLLQDISQEDAQAEGADRLDLADAMPLPSGCLSNNTYRVGFADLWNSIHGPVAWAANPYVVALTFDVRKSNIDV